MMKRNVRFHVSFLWIIGLLTIVPNTCFAPYMEEKQQPQMPTTIGAPQQPFEAPPGTSVAYMQAYIPVLVQNMKGAWQKVKAAPPGQEKRQAMTNVIKVTGSGIATLFKEGIKITGREVFKSMVSPSFWVQATPIILILILLIRFKEQIISGAEGAHAVYAQIMRLLDRLEQVSQTAGTMSGAAAAAASEAAEVLAVKVEKIAQVVDVGREEEEAEAILQQELQQEIEKEKVKLEEAKEKYAGKKDADLVQELEGLADAAITNLQRVIPVLTEEQILQAYINDNRAFVIENLARQNRAALGNALTQYINNQMQKLARE